MPELQICDRCTEDIPAGTGHEIASEWMCEQCYQKDIEAFAKRMGHDEEPKS